MSNAAIIVTKLAINPLLATAIKPAQLFAHFADQHWAFWLDSCASKHQDCQYDIMVFSPQITLTTQGNVTFIQHYDQQGKPCSTQSSEEDPLSLIETHQQQLFAKVSLPKTHLPFVGGALGYFAYDLGHRFEQFPENALNDINLPDMAVGIYQQAIIFEHSTQSYYLIAPTEQKTYWQDKIQQLINAEETTPTTQNNAKLSNKQAFKLTQTWQSNMSKSQYADNFAQVQQYLRAGDCYQINLAQRFHARYQGDEFQAYLALREANNAPFSAFMRIENAAILSISPERFLQVKQQQVQTKPIKGTMPRSTNTKEDKNNAEQLKQSAKDQAENLMIVDLLRNDISKACVAGSVQVPKLFAIESFPAVHHLVSTIEGKLADNNSAIDLLRGAFPGGSITGAPKIRAMEIIEQLEPHKRSVYCGSIGYISACGNMDTSITIRTLVCKTSPELHSDKNIYCWAGGGLVADSICTSEYQETFDKVNKILPILSQLTDSNNSHN